MILNLNSKEKEGKVCFSVQKSGESRHYWSCLMKREILILCQHNGSSPFLSASLLALLKYLCTARSYKILTGLKDEDVLHMEGGPRQPLQEGNLHSDQQEEVWNTSLMPGHNGWQRLRSKKGPSAANVFAR